MLFHIFDNDGRTDIYTVLRSLFNDLCCTDLLFKLLDAAFEERLCILRFIVFGVFRKVAHGNGFFQTLRDFRTFDTAEFVELLLHIFKAFFGDQGTLHFCHDNLPLF